MFQTMCKWRPKIPIFLLNLSSKFFSWHQSNNVKISLHGHVCIVLKSKKGHKHYSNNNTKNQQSNYVCVWCSNDVYFMPYQGYWPALHKTEQTSITHMVMNHQNGYPYLNLSLFFFFENIQKHQFFC